MRIATRLVVLRPGQAARSLGSFSSMVVLG